jgi:FkbM family methyltransferase
MSERGFDRWLLKKYTEQAIQILPTDTVIDCGAFVGAFSIAAFKQGAKKVFSIEPSSKNYKCTNLNIQHYNAQNVVTACNIGLGDINTNLKLNISTQSCEDSFLECDTGNTGKTELVQVLTLDTFIKNNSINPSNLYLKIEAEGFELEIVQGLTLYNPRVIVVDVTPERGGLSPRNDISSILIERGYNIFHTKRCLFATKS